MKGSTIGGIIGFVTRGAPGINQSSWVGCCSCLHETPQEGPHSWCSQLKIQRDQYFPLSIHHLVLGVSVLCDEAEFLHLHQRCLLEHYGSDHLLSRERRIDIALVGCKLHKSPGRQFFIPSVLEKPCFHKINCMLSELPEGSRSPRTWRPVTCNSRPPAAGDCESQE